MFVFFYSRSANSSSQPDLFLFIVTVSLLVWVMALRRSVLLQLDIAGREGNEQIQNPMSYYMLGLLPYILLSRKRVIKVIAFGLIAYGAFYSLKRGVILALALAGLGSTGVYLFYVCTPRELRRGIAAVLVVWILGTVVAVACFFINPEAFTHRLDMGSNRDEVYSAALSGIERSDIFESIAGHGFLKSLENTGYRTHNDLLFLQYDYGFVGVMLMLNIYFALCLCLRGLCKRKSPLAVSLAAGIILMFCVQMYSIGLYARTFGFVFGGLGLVVGSSMAREEDPALAQKSMTVSAGRPPA
jgi:hypothetical protein